MLKDALGWGFMLWLAGYVLGIVFFMLVPTSVIGWFVAPIGIIITLWVLYEKIYTEDLKYYLKLGVIWTTIAVILDYIFIIMILKPEESYYKPDVYLYYLFTFILPPLVGWYITKKEK